MSGGGGGKAEGAIVPPTHFGRIEGAANLEEKTAFIF